jgi:HSP20 family protein
MSLRQAMDRLFEDSFVRPETAIGSAEHQLALDIRTTDDAFVVEAALPGVKPEDVDISVLGDTLTINASHREEQKREETGYSYREIRRGSFTRTVTLPGGLKADAATASFENGMLTLRIPKAEEAKPRQIRITAGEGNGHTPATIEGSASESTIPVEGASPSESASENGA